jgi:Transposase DDE domain
VECARSRETVKRGGRSSLVDALTDAAATAPAPATAATSSDSVCTPCSRPTAPPGRSRCPARRVDEKLVCLQLVARCERQPDQALILIADKNFRGKDFETELANLQATIMRPRRKDEQGRGPHLAPIRQRLESIFRTCKDILTLERHAARTLSNLRVRLCARFAALAAAVMLNHQLGLPPAASPATRHNRVALLI